MKWIKIVEYVLLLMCVAVLANFLIQGASDSSVSLMLFWMYILFGLAVVVAIGSSITTMFINPKGAVRSLIGLVIAAAVLFLCYSLADATPLTKPDGVVVDNAFVLKVTDTGLYIAYLAFAGAILSILFGEVRNLFVK